MTKSQAKELWPIIKAWSEGGQLQYRTDDNLMWNDIDYSSFSSGPVYYRIKPTPRPWKPEEVPIGALIRTLHRPDEARVIIGVKVTGPSPEVILNHPLSTRSCYLIDLFTYHEGHNGDRNEHSLDHGKTWLPCGTLEE